MGYSNRINDPAFKKYLKNSNRYALFFSFGLSAIALTGFCFAGGRDFFFIGLIISGMFIGIAGLQILGRKSSKTWDGIIIDKKVIRKRNKSTRDTGSMHYMAFSILIKRIDTGKIITLEHRDDDTVYNYYKIGDKVRHHGGLNSYEKYDKSNDAIIFCAACGSLCDISEEVCFRCGCPLLK
ncbi:hypothetical protein [Fusibacter tunisiensis]|uniref:CHY-type Zn-finger protein n=1 Tax=Fusibacter tunisiensis TaxID=1008308 RepID=A0ABS2MMP7_9FIRM|nr:hypothetical protein [Fusibacter tunisiensis]MBM7560677.1 putative CHY-type Zn-finger protein [Fusibacter tunisiensis]